MGRGVSRIFGLLSLMMGMAILAMSALLFDEGFYAGFLALAGGLALIAAGIYMLRGKGQALKEFDTFYAIQQKKNEDLMAQGWRGMLGLAPPRNGSVAATERNHYDLSAAQLNAVANPATANALQNLQNLLYTRAITDAEYQAAKDKLLRSAAAQAHADSFAQLTKLVELHQAGILGDVEFAAAKLRVLGLS